jgi:hypothetical protein
MNLRSQRRHGQTKTQNSLYFPKLMPNPLTPSINTNIMPLCDLVQLIMRLSQIRKASVDLLLQRKGHICQSNSTCHRMLCIDRQPKSLVINESARVGHEKRDRLLRGPGVSFDLRHSKSIPLCQSQPFLSVANRATYVCLTALPCVVWLTEYITL